MCVGAGFGREGSQGLGGRVVRCGGLLRRWQPWRWRRRGPRRRQPVVLLVGHAVRRGGRGWPASSGGGIGASSSEGHPEALPSGTAPVDSHRAQQARTSSPPSPPLPAAGTALHGIQGSGSMQGGSAGASLEPDRHSLVARVIVAGRCTPRLAGAACTAPCNGLAQRSAALLALPTLAVHHICAHGTLLAQHPRPGIPVRRETAITCAESLLIILRLDDQAAPRAQLPPSTCRCSNTV